MSGPESDVLDVPFGRRAVGRIAPPGSKSHAMRLLILAALADGESCIAGVPDSEDARALIAALHPWVVETLRAN